MEKAFSELPPRFFQRLDEAPDADFYREPRLVVHIDEPAVRAVTSYLGEVLPEGAVLLDLMSSWRSHLPGSHRPESGSKRWVVGLGMNDAELRENPQLDERVVHDLNVDPTLPLESGRFDAAVITVSIQYITRPVEVFREVCRVLKPGGAFHVIFSDRMFPTKAVAIWQSLPEPERRGELIAAYFAAAAGWSEPYFLDHSPGAPGTSDPLYVVRAVKAG